MGEELYETSEVSRHIFDIASGITDIDLPAVCWGGEFDRIQETVVAQPALAAFLLSKYFSLHERGFTPDVGEGHSAGEIALLGMAKVFSIEDTFAVLKARSEAMLAAHIRRPGKMAAIQNLSKEQIRSTLEKLIESGRLSLTNLNSKGQHVISGDMELVDRAKEMLQNLKSVNFANKIKNGKVRILPIQIAAHSAYHMEPARLPFAQALKEVQFGSPDFDIVLNSTKYLSELGTDNLSRYLPGQLVKGVDFVGGTERLVSDGIRSFYDPGPKQTLSNLVLEDYVGVVRILSDEELLASS
jgi:[acyl-carrier-protein] S-malonyltransferase